MGPGYAPAGEGDRADLRLAAVAVLAWLSALVAAHAGRARVAALVAVLVVVLAAVPVLGLPALLGRGGHRRRTALLWLICVGCVAGGALLRQQSLTASPVTTLAKDRASVVAVLMATDDPRTVGGRFGAHTLLSAQVRAVTGRGRTYRVRTPVIVLAPAGAETGSAEWAEVRLGVTVRVRGRLAPSQDEAAAGLLVVRGAPRPLAAPGTAWRVTGAIREGVRRAVAGRSPGARSLVPGLVDGDDSAMPDALREDFRTTGLSHLVAVSGTNLTLVVGFLLAAGRLLGVRGRGLLVLGGIGVVGFVLLARAEPSVLRAAAMGTVGLVGMNSGGRPGGMRAWGAGVLALMLLDPALATSAGFALSAVATVGIVVLAAPWRDALAHWMPRWLAEAIAVPTAAQLACTPLLLGLFGQLSLVAVAANMAVAPVVGVATVLGLAGGVLAVAWVPAGAVMALPAAWCADWIVLVAERSAALPLASTDLPVTPVTTLLGTAGTLIAIGWLTRNLARRGMVLVVTAILAVVVLVPLPSLGWPPRGWRIVACDVGQGDALVLRAGPGSAVVVDTGPEPEAVDDCLRRLRVERVPLVVLTHFHADHIGGLAGVLRDRQVGVVVTSPYPVPEQGAEQVRALLARAGVPVRSAHYGEGGSLGPLRWQVLAPSGPAPPASASPANDDSVVLYVESGGIRMLLLGDEETGSQSRLHQEFPTLTADVLKVAHHGSAKQDPALLRSLRARVALISVGRDNDYGHPAPSLLALLRSAGPVVHRTDREGDLAVLVDGGLRVVSRR